MFIATPDSMFDNLSESNLQRLKVKEILICGNLMF